MNETPTQSIWTFGRLVQTVFGLAVFVAVLFVPAGTFRWPAAWALLIAYLVWMAGLMAVLLRRDPGLVRERADTMQQADSRQKVFLWGIGGLELAVVIVAGLTVRFGWATAAPWLQIVGWVAMTAGALLASWALTTNTFAAQVPRIQAERGHTVVSSGPYRYVRHPMYTGIVLMGPGLALGLGSTWALIPGLVFSLAFILRTASEDRMLRQDLPGYDNYATQTRYRLLPGLW